MDLRAESTEYLMRCATDSGYFESVGYDVSIKELARRSDNPKVVPPSGIEPEPQSGSNFKSDMSTNSTKGAKVPLVLRGLFPNHIREVLEEINLPFGWCLEARLFTGVSEKHSWTEYQVRITCGMTVDNMTGVGTDGWNGRWWRLSQSMTNGEIVQTVFKALMTALEHEAREMFLYKGVPVLDPHCDIDKLAELRKNTDMIKGRATA